MSTSDTDFDLELHFLPAWAKKAPEQNRYEHFAGEADRPSRPRGPHRDRGPQRQDRPPRHAGGKRPDGGRRPGGGRPDRGQRGDDRRPPLRERFDVFLYHWRRLRPKFSTLFLNSTAHFQHSYWRDMEPDEFRARMTPDSDRRHTDAIHFGYQRMDRSIGKLLRVCPPDSTIVLATGLSQQPFLKFEDIGGQRFYRATDLGQLLGLVGVVPLAIQPVMTHQYQLRFDSSDALERAEQALASARLGSDRPLFHIESEPAKTLFCGCQLRTPIDRDAAFTMDGIDRPQLFFDHFYLIDEIKSGCHHPEGALWIRAGAHRVHAEKVSVLDIFPTAIELMGIGYARSDQHPFNGRSLVPLWQEHGVTSAQLAA